MKVITDEERESILKSFEDIFEYCPHCRDDESRRLVKKAFDIAYEAHKGMRRKSGEPYIIHPLAVARICAEEIGLGTKSIISALLHDVVEDTDTTLASIENLFGAKIAQIIDGLTKISGIFDENSSLQAESFRKMLLTLSEDVRVILIKLADRLHNMRTLGSMPEDKKLKIASETLFLYAPLAHRLGLYAIKTELEDLSFKHKEPILYDDIFTKLKESESEREKYIETFCEPIKDALKASNFSFTVKGRAKSIFSVWNKMQKKNVPFEEIYDLFAIRVVFDPIDLSQERKQCWELYALITDIYRPNTDRLRDWISTPKANGYEALHLTVMGPQGKWVEVQIRSRRMDEIAERGYAAHWKYKGNAENESQLDIWLKKLRDVLENPDASALEFLDNFKMNLFSSEIFVFTPKGLLKRLPQGASALDFAFDIHSKIGYHAIGAKVNHKLEPLSYKLKSGDQVEILTSESAEPQREYLDFVITANAKSKLNEAFKTINRANIKAGQKILEKKINDLKLIPNSDFFSKVFTLYEVTNKDDLFLRIGNGTIDLNDFDEKIRIKRKNKLATYWDLTFVRTTSIITKGIGRKKADESESKDDLKDQVDIKKKSVILHENVDQQGYTLAKCCNPIPGEKVMGFLDKNGSVIIHKTTCPTAIKLMSSYGDRILTAKWTVHKIQSFLTTIKLTGFDRIGLVNDVTKVISEELNVNMRTVHFESVNGVFYGTIDLYVHNLEDLEHLMEKLKDIRSMDKVIRVESN